jgi:cell division septation protein DedD
LTTQTAPVAPATSGSGFSVQLAAEGSEDAARSKFNRLRSQYGDVLANQNPVIRNAEVNGRSVYRLRVGNMSREEANGLCERLKADGGSCFVARN